jgi:hypothetical protein
VLSADKSAREGQRQRMFDLPGDWMPCAKASMT